jgi:hypothetical protein
MALDSNHSHSVRRIVLPSGRSIEVVRFREPEEPARHGLHVCPLCSSQLVQPVGWSEAAPDRWELKLKCPNCWWSGDGLFSRGEVDRFEECLDDGMSAVLADLKRLSHANMAQDIERFVAALHAGHILPEDF